MTDRPLVSVIIPTKNSGTTIENCLKSIKKQTYPRIEIIVVDHLSTDHTGDIAKSYGVKVLSFRGGRTSARNYGVEQAKGIYLLHLDSDMELMPNIIKECVNSCRKNAADAIIIPEVSVGESFWTKCKSMEKQTYLHDPLIEAARFYRRESFEVLGGYDNELEAGEDWDLHQRARQSGQKMSRISTFIRHYEGKSSLTDLMRKKYQYGKTLDKYIRKHPDIAYKQLILFRYAYLRSLNILLKDPAHACGFILMKFFEVCAGGLGLIENKLSPKEGKIR